MHCTLHSNLSHALVSALPNSSGASVDLLYSPSVEQEAKVFED